MRDAVADEITARSRLEPSPGRFVAYSALAHLVLAAAFATAHMTHETPQKRNVINVRLASRGIPAGTPAPLAPSTRATSPSTPAARPPDVTPVPMTRPVPPAPVPPATKAPAKSSAGETLFGRSDRPPAPLPAPTSTQPVTRTPGAAPATGPAVPDASTGTAASPIGVPGPGKAGVLSLEGGPFPFNDYLERMISLVGRRWQRPVTGSDPTATIYFVVERNGRIRDARVEESSGVGSFDRAALRAVLESSPLPPLPNGYGGGWLGVHLAFH